MGRDQREFQQKLSAFDSFKSSGHAYSDFLGEMEINTLEDVLAVIRTVGYSVAVSNYNILQILNK